MLVTVVVPSGNVLPLGGILTTFTPLQLSEAVTVNATLLRLHCPGSASRRMLAGQLITGDWESCTITRCWQVAVFPLASRAVHVTTFVPTANCAGASFVTVTLPQL